MVVETLGGQCECQLEIFGLGRGSLAYVTLIIYPSAASPCHLVQLIRVVPFKLLDGGPRGWESEHPVYVAQFRDCIQGVRKVVCPPSLDEEIIFQDKGVSSSLEICGPLIYLNFYQPYP